jgi:hypothetical protein
MRFFDLDREYALTSSDRSDDEQGFQPVAALEAQWLINGARSSFDEQSLGRLVSELPVAPIEAYEASSFARVSEAVARGDIVVLRRVRPLDAREPDETEAETAPGDRPTEVEHWIQIQVVDDDDLPVPGVAMELKLPNGRVSRVRADSQGVVYVSDIDAGQCELRLTQFDAEVWEMA